MNLLTSRPSAKSSRSGYVRPFKKRLRFGGKASLVVSGGSTPVPLFAALSVISMEWDSVFITLADERWVEVSDKDSNEASVREHLLRNQAGETHFHGLKNSHASAVTGKGM